MQPIDPTVNTKPPQSLASAALDLIEAAEAVADRWVQEYYSQLEQPSAVRDGMKYAYLLAGLRFSPDYLGGHEAKDVVCQAMKIAYGMSTEEFATSILGG